MQEIAFSSRGYLVHGWAHSPAGARRAPAIALCHGFTGNCSEHGLFVEFAERAAQAGFYALRFDCVGSGESAGDFAEDTYLSGWCADILAALDFAAAQPGVDANRMGTMGISMGAGAALLAARDARVKAAAGWAPVLYPDEVFRKIMGVDKWALLQKGQSIHHAYAGEEFDVGPRFAMDAETLSIEQSVRTCGKPILLRLGTADQVIDKAHGDRLRALSVPDMEVQMVQGEDHGFLIHMQQNIEQTIAFFAKQFL